MASYTMPLRDYIEMWSQDNPDLTTRERIEIGRKKLFSFDYPIFDEGYRKVFETHFIRNFYMREIGFETEELFKMRLENWLSINMPYFNLLFKSEQIEFDPLINSKMNVKHTKKNDKDQSDNRNMNQTAKSNANTDTKGHSTDSTKGTSNITDDNFNRRIEADTPDSRLNLTTNDGEGILEYASKITEDNENNKRNGTTSQTGTADTTGNQKSNMDSNVNANDTLNSNINETEDFIQERIGKIGVQSYSEMIMKYRESFLRIEKQIFSEMQVLFMLVY